MQQENTTAMKTFRKIIGILCGMIAMSLPLSAQQPADMPHISGRVVDSRGEAVAGTAVILQTADSVYVTGTITGADGIFVFDYAQRPYMLLFQHVSFEPLVVRSSENDLGQIVLAEKQNEIDEIVVSAEKPLVQIDDGKLVYDSSSLLSGRVAGNAYEVVKQVPGVVEENDRLSLSGIIQPTVIINGKPSTMSAEQLVNLLKTMPASRVSKVEVMYNTPPQYHVRGAAINVVLKSSLYNAISGELFGEYYNRYLNSWRGGADMVFSTPKISGDVMYSYTSANNISNIDLISEHLFQGNIYDIRQAQEIRNINRVHDARIGLDYNIDDDNTLSLTYTSSVLPHLLSTTYATGNYSNSASGIEGDNVMHNVAMRYSWRNRLTTGVDYTDYALRNDQSMTDLEHPEYPYFISYASQKIRRLKAYLDHTLVMKGGWNMRYGVSFDYARSNDVQEYVSENADMSDHDTFSTLDEYTYDIYAGADKNFAGGFSASAYLTGEYYRRNGYERLALLPQLSLSYMADPNHVVQLSVSSDKIYPSYWQMQESLTFIDGYSQVSGNAELKPMYNYQTIAMYMFRQKYILQLFYIRTLNYFQQSVFQSPENLSLVYQTLNWKYSSNCGFYVVVPFNAGRVLDSRVTLMGGEARIVNDDFNGMAVDRRKWVWSLYMNNSFAVCRKPSVSIEVSGWWQSPSIQTTYDIASLWSVNAGLKCSLLRDKLSINIMCSDIFESAIPKAYVNFNTQNIEIINAHYTRMVTLRLSYKIGGYKQRAYEGVDTSRFGH